MMFTSVSGDVLEEASPVVELTARSTLEGLAEPL